MVLYTKESLERLKGRIDLYEVLSMHLELQSAGSTYKALCPFHEEKTPSFVLRKGDTHYHCFGCGAHGDAIAFLMQHLKMTFAQAVETLGERFQVPLEKTDVKEKKGLPRTVLRDALEQAVRFYHFFLLQTEEGKEALEYLFARGIDLEMIRTFEIGLSPKEPHVFRKVMKADDKVLEEVGLRVKGKQRDFFIDRIMFPVRDSAGFMVAFSGRKFHEDTFGGKYINTPETALFKKSRILFGLHFGRRRIIEEKRAIIVEGQIDALRLIHNGFDFAVAAQGTAFGEGHVKELLQLGVEKAYLALDSDEAGYEAAGKIGNLFQKRGVEVSVILLPKGMDPDSFLQKEGPEQFAKQMEKAFDYLTFLYRYRSRKIDIRSPSAKSHLIETIATQIRLWDSTVMIHESLKKLSNIAAVPEEVIGVSQYRTVRPYLHKRGVISPIDVDPDQVLETDLLLWLYLLGERIPKLVQLAEKHLHEEHFRDEWCRDLYLLYLDLAKNEKPRDLLSIDLLLESDEQRSFLHEILKKKINGEKAEQHFLETVRKLKERQWMEEREAIKQEIHRGGHTENEVLELAKRFDQLTKEQPVVVYE